jgi:hypothetical protein
MTVVMPDNEGVVNPEFPITVTFHEDREAWTAESLEELLAGLPYFDSDDPSQRATVTDALGRLVRLRILNMSLLAFEVTEDWGFR